MTPCFWVAAFAWAVCPAICAGGLPFIRVRCCKSLFPAELLEHACCRACLGGELDPDALQGTDRLVAGLAIRSFGFATLPRLDLHRADAFVQRFLMAQP